MGKIINNLKEHVRTRFINNHLDIHVGNNFGSEYRKVSVMREFDNDLNAATTYPELVDVVRYWWTSFDTFHGTHEQAEAVIKAIISVE